MKLKGFDDWTCFFIFGYNEAEGFDLGLGGRTYFAQNDQWRLKGFGAYGFKDDRFKFGLSAKVLLNRKNRASLIWGIEKM